MLISTMLIRKHVLASKDSYRELRGEEIDPLELELSIIRSQFGIFLTQYCPSFAITVILILFFQISVENTATKLVTCEHCRRKMLSKSLNHSSLISSLKQRENKFHLRCLRT